MDFINLRKEDKEISDLMDKELKRQREGIDCMPIDPKTGKRKSKKTGKLTGRPVKNEYPKDWEQNYELYKKGTLKAKRMQAMYEWPKSTFYYMIKKYEENKK